MGREQVAIATSMYESTNEELRYQWIRHARLTEPPEVSHRPRCRVRGDILLPLTSSDHRNSSCFPIPRLHQSANSWPSTMKAHLLMLSLVYLRNAAFTSGASQSTKASRVYHWDVTTAARLHCVIQWLVFWFYSFLFLIHKSIIIP